MKTLLLVFLMASATFAESRNPFYTVEYEVKAASGLNTDILLVIDNSGSMDKYQQKLLASTDAFLNNLQNVNYKIAAISTDTTNLNKWPSNTISSNSATAHQEFKDLISSFGTNGSYDEKPLEAIVQFLSKSSGQPFLRPHSTFQIIIVTDEHAQGTLSIDDFNSKIGTLKPIVNTFTLINPGSTCGFFLPPHNTKLEDLTKATSGMLLDICSFANVSALSTKIVKDATQGTNNDLIFPIASHKFMQKVDVDSIEVFYGDQEIPKAHLHTGWVYDENQNSVLFGKDIKLSPQKLNTKLIISYKFLAN